MKREIVRERAPVLESGRIDWKLLAPAVVLAVLWLALWGNHIFRSAYFALATDVQDDTYYYLLPAWNLSRTGWFTFDGLTSSYGFQPLWELGLALVAMFLPSREALLRASLFIGAILFALTAVAIARAAALLWCRGRRSGGGWSATIAALALLVNVPVQSSNLTGKENALYGLLFAVLLNVRLGESTRLPRFPYLAGVVGGLILLARLTPMSLAVVAIQPLILNDPWGRRAFAWRYAIAMASTVAPWLVYAKLAFGSPIPTSAYVRTEGLAAYLAGGGPGILAAAKSTVEYLNACSRFSIGIASSFWGAAHQFDTVGGVTMTLVALSGFAWLVASACKRVIAGDSAERYVVLLLGAIVSASAIIPILLSRDSADMYYRRWYIVELPLMAALLAGIGAESIEKRARRLPVVLQAVVMTILLVCAAGAARDTIAIGAPTLVYEDRGRWQDVALRATLWSNHELGLTRSNRVGAFSAGLLAWFSTATVVNLDGLANDEVAKARNMHWSADQYCAYRDVRLYVDTVDPALLFEKYSVRASWPNESREFPIYYVAEIGGGARQHAR